MTSTAGPTSTVASTSTESAVPPLADARTLALAHYAVRGLLESVLAPHGITFQQQITLRAAVTADGPQSAADLVGQVRNNLKADPADVRATVDELLSKSLLVADGAYLRPTDAGRELIANVGAQTAPVSARVWGGISEADLAATGRVLTLVTERANAELAAPSA